MVKRTDDRVYIRKFSRKKKTSLWPDRNRSLAEALIENGLMTPRGEAAIHEAKVDGWWFVKPKSRIP